VSRKLGAPQTDYFKKAPNDTTVVIFTNDQTIEANMGLYHKDIQKVLDIFYGVYLKANWSIEIFQLGSEVLIKQQIP